MVDVEIVAGEVGAVGGCRSKIGEKGERRERGKEPHDGKETLFRRRMKGVGGCAVELESLKEGKRTPSELKSPGTASQGKNCKSTTYTVL